MMIPAQISEIRDLAAVIYLIKQTNEHATNESRKQVVGILADEANKKLKDMLGVHSKLVYSDE